MPEYLRTHAPGWDRRRNWATVRKELEELRRAGEDCRAFHVRTSARAGDEEPAVTHPETRTLFSPAPEELPPPADSDPREDPRPSGGVFSPAPEELPPPADPDPREDPRPSGGIDRLRDAIERMNAGASYHDDSGRRRRWVVEWLATGADPAARDPEGWAPLHFAAAGSWDAEAVAALVAAGGAVDAPNADDCTPLHLAARYGSPEVARALRAAGAEIDAREAGGRTALHVAACEGAPASVARMVAALVDTGAEVDARTQNGWTPLHLAAWHGAVEAVDALGVAGADANARNKDGWTPLHLVARHDRPKAIASALVAAGADPGLPTGDGWTALLLASAQADRELVELLLAVGSDIGVRNHDGSTALDLAVALRRPPDVIQALGAAVQSAGRSRDPSARGVEPPARELPGGAGSSASPSRPGQTPSWKTGLAGVYRASRRYAGSRPRGGLVPPLPAAGLWRPRWLRPWMGAVAAVIAIVVVVASLGNDDAPSPSLSARGELADGSVAPSPSPPARGELVDGPVATPPGVAAPLPADTGADPGAEDALNLDGSARQRIQRGLSAAGFEPGPADGRFGPGTREAVRAWQLDRGAPATGYLSAGQADELSDLGTRRREYAAAERRGMLTVRAAPASRIALNGADVGATGATGLLVLSDVQPGRHIVVARKEGHAEATSVVEVFEDRAEIVELTLVALSGRLTATANVADALLRIEDAGDHRLPLSGLEIPAGSHRVTVSRAGFRSVENDVEIRPGELTTLDLVLDPVPIEGPLQAALDRFAAGNYREAAEAARSLLQLRPDAGAAHLLLGTALYYLGQFDQSLGPLERAIELGEEVVLPAKHRHGGVGLREGFCRGTITLSRSRIAFVSREQPDHGFSVTPDRVTDLEIVESIGGSAFRLNARVEDEERGIRRRNFDFVHRNATRQQRDPDFPLFALTCLGCDASLNVQVALMNYLTRISR